MISTYHTASLYAIQVSVGLVPVVREIPMLFDIQILPVELQTPDQLLYPFLRKRQV